jgi:hypothetical protein
MTEVSVQACMRLLSRHLGLEPGSILQAHVRRTNGSRLKAGMTVKNAASVV